MWTWKEQAEIQLRLNSNDQRTNNFFLYVFINVPHTQHFDTHSLFVIRIDESMLRICFYIRKSKEPSYPYWWRLLNTVQIIIKFALKPIKFNENKKNQQLIFFLWKHDAAEQTVIASEKENQISELTSAFLSSRSFFKWKHFDCWKSNRLFCHDEINC